MQRGFAHLLPLLVLLLALVGGGWLYLNSQNPKLLPPPTTTPDNPITEKTYSNKDLGFEFKYPAELTAQEDSEEEYFKRSNGNIRKNFTSYVGYAPGEFLGAVSVVETSTLIADVPGPPATPSAFQIVEPDAFDSSIFTVWVFKNPANLTETQWFNEYWYYPFNWGQFASADKAKVAPLNEATISGKLAKYGIVSHYPGKPKYIYLSNEGKMYLFRVFTENNAEGEKILNSFKFLSANNEIADWKTYTNDKGKYSIKYPVVYSIYPNQRRVFEGDFEPFENITEFENSKNDTFPYKISIFYKTDSAGLSLEQYLDKNSYCDAISSKNGITIKVDGEKALKYENTTCGPAGTTEIYTLNKDIIYNISFPDCCDELMYKKVDQILSTFKFLD